MPEELIEKVKYRVNRDSPEDKTRDFLKWMEGARKEIVHLVSAPILLHHNSHSYTLCFVLCRLHFANIGTLTYLYTICE